MPPPMLIVPVALALVHRHDRWLVGLRYNDTHLGGFWEFPGGKIERHESAAECALRELREEYAVEAEVERALTTISHTYIDRTVTLTPVVCRWLVGEARAVQAVQCRWVSRSELHALTMPAANAEVLRLAGLS